MEGLIYTVAMVVLVAVLVAEILGRISAKTAAGLFALVSGGVALVAIHEGDHLGAVLNSAVCAWHTWRWWNGGGGDDTKRRLRSAAKRFEPVRRTAPVGAA